MWKLHNLNIGGKFTPPGASILELCLQEEPATMTLWRRNVTLLCGGRILPRINGGVSASWVYESRLAGWPAAVDRRPFCWFQRVHDNKRKSRTHFFELGLFPRKFRPFFFRSLFSLLLLYIYFHIFLVCCEIVAVIIVSKLSRKIF